jgi:hypothetical protein
MTTATDYRAIAEMLCATLHDTTTTTTLDDGRRVRVSIEPDPFGGFGDEQDFYGEVIETRDNTRPAHFDGASRKFRHRHGFVWWQPPTDARRDPDVLESLAKRVQDYFLERWYYASVTVEVTSPPCATCAHPHTAQRSFGGIESDDMSTIVAAVTDLFADLDD